MSIEIIFEQIISSQSIPNRNVTREQVATEIILKNICCKKLFPCPMPKSVLKYLCGNSIFSRMAIFKLLYS